MEFIHINNYDYKNNNLRITINKVNIIERFIIPSLSLNCGEYILLFIVSYILGSSIYFL